MNKHQKYLEYIINDIEPPYFKNMEEMYGLKPKEYNFILPKVYDQPVTIDDKSIYDNNDNEIYFEGIDGSWYKREYDQYGNVLYREFSNGFWIKNEYNENGKVIYYENSDGVKKYYK